MSHVDRICGADNCDALKRSSNAEYCPKHQARVDRYGSADGSAKTHKRIDQSGECSLDVCSNPKFGKSSDYCPGHLQRKKRGTPDWDGPLQRSYAEKGEHCKWDGCKKVPHARGFCAYHYTRTRMMEGKTGTCLCCDRPAWARSLCNKHLSNLMRNGTPIHPDEWDPEFFFSERLMGAKTSEGCIPYLGEITPSGHGRWNGPRNTTGETMAHRAAYTFIHGPIPEGKVLDHVCHDPETCPGGVGCLHRRCVNPYHLKAVTRKENSSSSRKSAGTRYTKEISDVRNGFRVMTPEQLGNWVVRNPEAAAELAAVGDCWKNGA